MAGMQWFWRLVCSPDCSEACQVNCPGCRAMAPEWEAKGRTTIAGTAPARPFRWSKLRHLVSCWSGSVMARTLGRLIPFRIVRRTAAHIPSGGCGCGPASGAATGSTAGGCCGSGSAESRIKDEVQRHYSAQARRVMSGVQEGCCSPGLPTDISCTTMYGEDDLRHVPADALTASLGCGNPMARTDLRPGDVVLDLGSGGGMDVLVAARRVGQTGRVIGLDMSEDMLHLARTNAASAGVRNVEFLRGELEAIPLPDRSVDVIISNCVVNLSPDKAAAMREAFRVLRPGGRLAISDIVTRAPVPESLKGNLTAWSACVGGALSESEYEHILTAAGFVDADISRDREYTAEDAELAGLGPVLSSAGLAGILELGFASASVRAGRPAAPNRERPISVKEARA